MSLIKVVNEGLLNSQKALDEQNKLLSDKLRETRQQGQDSVNNARNNATLSAIDNINYKKKNKQLQEEVDFYKGLLTKPFKEIAALTGGTFEEAYDEQQALLGNWIVSQRAFKEIAIKFGISNGKSKEEIIQEGIATKAKVLNNETEYNNNFVNEENNSEDNDWAIFYTPKIKSKFNIK